MLEDLWKAASVFHAEGTKKAEEWVFERLRRVLPGKASTVAGHHRGHRERGRDLRRRQAPQELHLPDGRRPLLTHTKARRPRRLHAGGVGLSTTGLTTREAECGVRSGS